MMTAVRNRPDGPRYLYAILPNAEGGRMPDRLDDEIYLVKGHRFAAVVRDAAAPPIVARDRQALARSLLAHQQVIERVMTWAPVLPVKFGTVAPDGKSVALCLASGAAAFAEALQRVKSKTQFEILVTWNPEPVFAAIAVDDEVMRLKRELTADGGAPDPVASARLGALVKRMFDGRRRELGDAIAQVLRQMADDVIANALMDDRMVLNLALLVDDDRIAALDEGLETLDARYDGKLTFRCVGPLPAHSFAAVEVSFLDADKIARARKVLELDAVWNTKTVRAAYRRLAKSSHPDMTTRDDDGERIAELNDAFTILSSYADAGGPVVVAVGRSESATAAGSG